MWASEGGGTSGPRQRAPADLAPSVSRGDVANAERSNANLSGILVAAIGVGLFALATFSPSVVNDGDTWSQVSIGEPAHRSVQPFDAGRAGEGPRVGPGIDFGAIT